jgi:hypothetical protein
MEPMVIFSVGVVVYCGFLTLADMLRDMERERRRAVRAVRLARIKAYHGKSRTAATLSTRNRGDAGGAHWPALLKGSV